MLARSLLKCVEHLCAKTAHVVAILNALDERLGERDGVLGLIDFVARDLSILYFVSVIIFYLETIHNPEIGLHTCCYHFYYYNFFVTAWELI